MRSRGAALPLLLTAMAACRFDGEIGPGFACDDAACPDGGAPAPRCGTLRLVADDFEDDVIGPQWLPFADPGASLDERDGDLVVAMEAGTGNPYAGLHAAAYHDLVEGEIVAEVSGVAAVATILEVRDHHGGKAQLVDTVGQLTAAVYDVPDGDVRASVPYDAEQHRFWRIREEAGDLYWETSPDGVGWDELHHEAMPIDPAHVIGIVSAGEQTDAGPTEARFEAVGGDPPAGLAYCPGGDLADDFEQAPLDPLWDSYADPSCTIAESGGALTIVLDGTGGDEACGIVSTHWYDLRDSAIVIDAGGAAAIDGINTFLQVEAFDDTETRLEIELEQGGILDIEQQVEGVDTDATTVTYAAGDQRYWRIRGTGGRVLLDTSADQVEWDNHLDLEPRFDLSRVRIDIGALQLAPGVGSPVTVTIAGVNQE